MTRPRAGNPDRVTKVPARRLGRTLYLVRPDEPSAWMSLEAARAEVAGGQAEGIGVCLPDRLCMVDIDDVLHGGILTADIQQIVDWWPTWTEVSPSGTGLHLWYTTTAPLRSGRTGALELLASGRFVTISGRNLPGTVRTIAKLPDELSTLLRPADRPRPSPQEACGEKSNSCSDTAFSVAFQRSGTLRRLYLHGDTSAYRSPSEADLALCQLLHRWVGPDPVRIDVLFRDSALCRRKWESAVYREKTLALALTTGHWQSRLDQKADGETSGA